MTDEKWPGTPGMDQTQPITPPGAAPDAAPDAGSVAVDTPPANGVVAESPTSEPDWQAKYEDQKRKTTLFMGATVVAVAALIGSLFFAVARSNSGGADEFVRGGLNGPTQQFGGPGQGMGGAPGRGFDHHDFDGDDEGGSDDGASQGLGAPSGQLPPGLTDQGTAGSTDGQDT
ncbi:MAG: hypothetical protein U0R64_02020 [Candidatus Nanopelagicales bacterium]